jgi:hypothetical protein
MESLALLAHLADVGRNRTTIVLGPTESVADRRQTVMEPRDTRAERGHHFGRQSPPVSQAVEQLAVVEPAHDNQRIEGVIGCLADLAQHQPAAVAPPDRGNAKIDLGRQAMVDVNLGLTHDCPPLGRGEIHVRKLHGALELVGTLVRQKDHGTMRVDTLRGRQAAFEEVDDLSLILDNESRTRRHAV